MKTQTSLCVTAALAALIAGTAPVTLAVEPTQVIEGRLTQITTEQVTLDGVRTFRIEPQRTECFDFRSDRTTCATLALIGYADKARLSVAGTVVRRIDLLELQQ